MQLSLDECLAQLSANVLACSCSFISVAYARGARRHPISPLQSRQVLKLRVNGLPSLLTCAPLWTRNKEATVCGDSISSQTLLTCPCYCFLFSNFRPRILGMPESGKFIVRVPVYRRKFLVISNLNHTIFLFYFFILIMTFRVRTGLVQNADMTLCNSTDMTLCNCTAMTQYDYPNTQKVKTGRYF